MKCRTCRFGVVVFDGEVRTVAVCRLRGDGLFLDADKDRKSLLVACPQAKLEYFDLVTEDGERVSGAYTIEVPELYCGRCSSYACCDPCPLVY